MKTAALASIIFIMPLGAVFATDFNSVNVNGSLTVDVNTRLGSNGNSVNTFNGQSNFNNHVTVDGNITLGDSGSDITTIKGNIVGTGTNNTLGSQTLTGNGSIITRSLGDARYLMSADLGSYSTTAQMNSAISGALVPYSTTVQMNTAVSGALVPYSTTAQMNTAISTAVTPLRTIDTSYSKTDSDNRFFNNNDAQIIVGSNETTDANAAIIVANGVDPQNTNNAFVVKKTGIVQIGQIEIDPATNIVKVPKSGDIEMGDYQ